MLPDEPTTAALRGAFQSGKTVGVLDKIRSTQKLVGNVETLAGLLVMAGIGRQRLSARRSICGAPHKAAENMDINIGGTVEVQVDMDDHGLVAAIIRQRIC